jgi:hypothetical protein
MDLEIPLFLQTWCAEVALFISRRVRQAAARAIRWAYGPDRLAAIRTDYRGCLLATEEGVTNGADRREDKVQ